MDPDDSLQSLQGLQLLVYTAAETGAQQFIELIFNSSAARVVFNAYRDTSPLPEDVARDYGYEDTAQYLESITKRYTVFVFIPEHLEMWWIKKKTHGPPPPFGTKLTDPPLNEG